MFFHIKINTTSYIPYSNSKVGVLIKGNIVRIEVSPCSSCRHKYIHLSSQIYKITFHRQANVPITEQNCLENAMFITSKLVKKAAWLGLYMKLQDLLDKNRQSLTV